MIVLFWFTNISIFSPKLKEEFQRDIFYQWGVDTINRKTANILNVVLYVISLPVVQLIL